MSLLAKKYGAKRTFNADHQPGTYKDMATWLNSLSVQQWKAILGAYAVAGNDGIIAHLRLIYTQNIEKWRDKDLRFFFESRKLSEFITKLERN